MGLLFYTLEDMSYDEHRRNEKRIKAIKDAAATEASAIREQTKQIANDAKERADMERKKITQIGTLARQIEPLLTFRHVKVDDKYGNVEYTGPICFRASDVKTVIGKDYRVWVQSWDTRDSKYKNMKYSKIILWDETVYYVEETVEVVNERIAESTNTMQKFHIDINQSESLSN